MGRRSLVITTVLLLTIATYGLWSAHKRLNQPAPTEGHAVPFRMSDRIASLKVEGEGDQLRLRFGDGQKGTALTPGEFAAMVGTLQKKKERGGYLFKVMHADRRRLQQLQVKIPENHVAAQSETQ